MCGGDSQREDSLPWQQRQWQSWRRGCPSLPFLAVPAAPDLLDGRSEPQSGRGEGKKKNMRRTQVGGREERGKRGDGRGKKMSQLTSLCGRPAAEKMGIFWPRAILFMVSMAEIPV